MNAIDMICEVSGVTSEDAEEICSTLTDLINKKPNVIWRRGVVSVMTTMAAAYMGPDRRVFSELTEALKPAIDVCLHNLVKSTITLN
jgi:hypothetical protein